MTRLRPARLRPARVHRQRPARRRSPAPAAVPPRGRRGVTAAARRTPITTRAALLGLVVSALTLLVALPLRTYLGQHATITAQETAQAEQRHRVEVLRRQVARGEDPAVVERLARQRLQLTFPGQTDYVVLAPSAAPAPPPPRDRPTSVVPPAVRRPWWGALWDSAGVAGGAR